MNRARIVRRFSLSIGIVPHLESFVLFDQPGKMRFVERQESLGVGVDCNIIKGFVGGKKIINRKRKTVYTFSLTLFLSRFMFPWLYIFRILDIIRRGNSKGLDAKKLHPIMSHIIFRRDGIFPLWEYPNQKTFNNESQNENGTGFRKLISSSFTMTRAAAL